ncbi:hypothetical protein BHM03_00042339 [Ensete ventricosum]|nr:hypothetical protein BHM03_00042339 [Ensete ventricosum]
MIDGSRQQRDRESSTDSRFSLFLSLFFFLPWLIPPEIGSKSIVDKITTEKKRSAAAIHWKSSEMREAALSGPLETDTDPLTDGQDNYGKQTFSRWRSTTAEERGGRLGRLADQGETRGEIVEPNRTRGPGSVGP